MIKIASLDESETFDMFYKNRKWGIKADSMLILDKTEIYYSKEDEIIYIDDLGLQSDGKEGYELLSKKSLNELLKYLGWEDFSIGIYYYAFDNGILCIKKN